jgi:hypothetical protein
MDYIVYPLAITTPSWPTFIEACQSSFGFSPTRVLDDSNIPLKAPNAFNESLRSIFGDDSRILSHFHFSFLAILDDEMLSYCYDWLTPLAISYKDYSRKRLVVISGTADVWIRKIVEGCSQDVPESFRRILNEICTLLEAAGLRSYFDKYVSSALPDGTFIFRK